MIETKEAKRALRQRQAEATRRRSARERVDLKLKPWELAPSEVDDGPCPWPANTAGAAGWVKAQQQRREILVRNPHYFDG